MTSTAKCSQQYSCYCIGEVAANYVAPIKFMLQLRSVLRWTIIMFLCESLRFKLTLLRSTHSKKPTTTPFKELRYLTSKMSHLYLPSSEK